MSFRVVVATRMHSTTTLRTDDVALLPVYLVLELWSLKATRKLYRTKSRYKLPWRTENRVEKVSVVDAALKTRAMERVPRCNK